MQIGRINNAFYNNISFNGTKSYAGKEIQELMNKRIAEIRKEGYSFATNSNSSDNLEKNKKVEGKAQFYRMAYLAEKEGAERRLKGIKIDANNSFQEMIKLFIQKNTDSKKLVLGFDDLPYTKNKLAIKYNNGKTKQMWAVGDSAHIEVYNPKTKTTDLYITTRSGKLKEFYENVQYQPNGRDIESASRAYLLDNNKTEYFEDYNNIENVKYTKHFICNPDAKTESYQEKVKAGYECVELKDGKLKEYYVKESASPDSPKVEYMSFDSKEKPNKCGYVACSSRFEVTKEQDGKWGLSQLDVNA